MEEILSELKVNGDAVDEIERIIDYRFINENLLRQAFTRRSFALDHDLSGCSEELEFLGDSVLNSIVTREMFAQFSEIERECVSAPFASTYDEGELTKIRSRFVCKEHLSMRCEALGLDKYILYGAGDVPSENSKEDAIEALIGAVAVDCKWDMKILANVVDRLVAMQFRCIDSYLQKDFYEVLNTWHQRHFGEMPEYEVYESRGGWCCSVRYKVPDFTNNTYTYDRADTLEGTRSQARAGAAQRAYDKLVRIGAWVDLRDAGIEPEFEKSINQVQELFQKKYIAEKPEYEYEERPGDEWYVTCKADTYKGWGIAGNKTRAKKKASFMLLYHLYRSAGITKDEWRETVYGRMMER